MTLKEVKLKLAAVIDEVLDGNVSATASKTLEQFIANIKELSEYASNREIEEAYHLLQHYIIDEDIRSRDAEYANSQRMGLRRMADRLRANS